MTQLPESTKSVTIPTRLIDRVIGQQRAVDVVQLAAKQRRFLLLVGEPGTGKSLLGQAVAELLEGHEPSDILAIGNKQETTLPHIQNIPAGTAAEFCNQAQTAYRKTLLAERYLLWTIAAATVFLSLFFAFRDGSLLSLGIGTIVLAVLYFVNRRLSNGRSRQVPKILVSNSATCSAPFIDATGCQAGALLGDVRHDPYQSGGSETPPHQLLEAGCVHRSHKGVLYIDEVATLSLESQQSLLTAIQEKQMPILGRSPGSSGTMVRSEPVPCDFLLVVAGNLEDIEKMHPALRSRIRGYGYEVFTNSQIPVTLNNTQKMVQFIAQEVNRDGKIPHVSRDGIAAILDEAQQRAESDGYYSTRFRELGGLIRIAGDLAVQEEAELINAAHVFAAREYARSLEEQIAAGSEPLRLQEGA